jgi:predicted amidohydrolase YtcJ
MDVLTVPFLGARWRWQYPFRSLRAAGAVVAMGSDWSVTTANPLWEMEIAVERTYREHVDDRGVFLPEERLELIDALAAFTSGSAYVNHLDDETGTLEVGKLADLAVLDRDLFDRGAGAIGEARVVGTFVEGAAVFEDPDLGG